MYLSSNLSQVTSKCGKNRKGGIEGDRWVSPMFLPHLMSSVIKYWTYWQHRIYLLYIVKKQEKKFNDVIYASVFLLINQTAKIIWHII